MNITSYVKKNRETFADEPFNEVDSLVLCELSYLHYTRAFAGAPRNTLRDMAKDVKTHNKDTLLPLENIGLLKAIANSPRFADVKVGYFRERNSVKRETRFAAMTFELAPDLHYVAFRGTDITLLGWKEDFNMAIVKAIPSQKLALQYLQTVASKVDGDLILGGHSKGGNLVVYAGVYASPELQDRLFAIYDHDGPGFRTNIFGDPKYLRVADKIRKTVPHDSIIGMLLNVMERYEVVESNSFSVMQHNPFSWQIEDNHFIKLPETARTSVAMEQTLTTWISGLDRKTTQKLTNAIFAVLFGSGATTVPQLLRRPIGRLRNMKRAFDALDDESKSLLTGNGKYLMSLWFASMKHVYGKAAPEVDPQ